MACSGSPRRPLAAFPAPQLARAQGDIRAPHTREQGARPAGEWQQQWQAAGHPYLDWGRGVGGVAWTPPPPQTPRPEPQKRRPAAHLPPPPRSQSFTPENVTFQEKIVMRSGLGDQTALPPGEAPCAGRPAAHLGEGGGGACVRRGGGGCKASAGSNCPSNRVLCASRHASQPCLWTAVRGRSDSGPARHQHGGGALGVRAGVLRGHQGGAGQGGRVTARGEAAAAVKVSVFEGGGLGSKVYSRH